MARLARFVIPGQPQHVIHLCHCSRCRKSTGTAHVSNIFTPAENIKWSSGKNNLKRFELSDAKSFSKQVCINCGSAGGLLHEHCQNGVGHIFLEVGFDRYLL